MVARYSGSLAASHICFIITFILTLHQTLASFFALLFLSFCEPLLLCPAPHPAASLVSMLCLKGLTSCHVHPQPGFQHPTRNTQRPTPTRTHCWPVLVSCSFSSSAVAFSLSLQARHFVLILNEQGRAREKRMKCAKTAEKSQGKDELASTGLKTN